MSGGPLAGPGAYAAGVIGASPFGPPPPGLRFAPVLRSLLPAVDATV